jgi:hypothetical protein
MTEHLKYYYELHSVSTIADELLNYCNSFEQWHRPDWATFLQTGVPRDILEKDFFTNTLLEQGWIPLLFKSEPKSIYQFHSDRGNRPVAINMLLGEPDSVTLYLGDFIYKNQYKLITVNYKPNRYYLLNTTEKHAVLNYGTDRYTLTFSPPEKYCDPTWDPNLSDQYVTTLEAKKIYPMVVRNFKQQKL